MPTTHLAGEDQTEEDGYGELAVAEEDDVQQVRVGRVLEEEPETCETIRADSVSGNDKLPFVNSHNLFTHLALSTHMETLRKMERRNSL